MTYIGKRRNRGSHHLPALVCGVLLALLMAGCAAPQPDNPGDGPPPDKAENKLPPRAPEDTAVGNLLKTLDDTLVKVEGREETFADAGNTRGAQLMNEAAGNVKAMQAAARAAGDGAVALSASSSAEATTATPDQREAFNRIVENRRQLMENIREARRCCGLPADFMDEELRKMDADIRTLRTQLGLKQDEKLEETTGSTPEQYESGSATGGALGEIPSATSTSTATSTSEP